LREEDISAITVRTFSAADGLARIIPKTTEQAQFNLVWPVATAAVRGRFGVDDVLGRFHDRDVAAVAPRVNVVVDPKLTSLFPGQRLSAVEVELRDGKRLAAGPREAPGEATDPEWEAIVLRKRAELIDDEEEEPLGFLCSFDRAREAAIG
jgi:2-methylcitrate dehydratase PrpD